jgi:hypothetical protein
MPQARNELLFRLKYFKFVLLIATVKKRYLINLSVCNLKSKNHNKYELINTNYGGN